MIHAQPLHRFDRGFTLLEVIVSVGLLVMLAGFAFGFLWNLWVQRDRAEDWAKWSGEAATMLERIERDMLGVIAGDAEIGAGLSGDSHRLRILSRGVSLVGFDTPGSLPDVMGSEYVFDEASGTISLRGWRPGAGEAGDEVDTVMMRVEQFRIRFFDGREWVSSFDSLDVDRLPAAVEIALWRGEPQRDSERADDARLAEALRDRSGGGDVLSPPLGPPEDSLSHERSWDAQPWRIRPPDRLRVIVAPDGPMAGWREGV